MFFLRHLPDTIATAVGLAMQCVLAASLWRRTESRAARRTIAGLFILVCTLILVALALRSPRVALYFPSGLVAWTGSAALTWIIVSTVALIAWGFTRFLPKLRTNESPARRQLLLTARGAILAAPVVVAGYAVFIQRSNLRLKEVDIPIANLPKELNGLKLVQVSDIHLSAFLSEAELARAIDMANETKAHLALVTGDLITSASDPVDTCLRQLKRLRADAGVIGCLGNHEVYAGAEDYVEQQGARIGIQFLRSQNRVLRFGGRDINFAGVDYQKMRSPYLLGADRMLQPGMPNVLLSHNPDVFPVAAQQGYDVTIGGHTHGGQINFEILHHNVNVARFYTPYVYGLYRKGSRAIYVTRGIGTVGVPARLGAPPEVALIRLCTI